jgi:phosphatidate phosphatase APP1
MPSRLLLAGIRALGRAARDVVHQIERPFEAVAYQVKQRLGHLRPVLILPYRWFGSADELRLRGRVLEDRGIARGSESDSRWANLRTTLRRFASSGIPDVRLRARYRGHEIEIVTDEEGYFFARLPVRRLPKQRRWHPIEFELLDRVVESQEDVHATGYVMVPPGMSGFGIISDLDDTVLQTDVTNTLKMLRNTFLRNAHTRLPFEGVAAFYRALRNGGDGCSRNPVFYVSNSPWNLYDLLVNFLDLHDIPLGPLLLRDLGVDRAKMFAVGGWTHKTSQIQSILSTYPSLPFILIGDSGEQDPEIYRQVIHDFPDRILAIYIREVTRDVRARQVRDIARDVRRRGVNFLLAQDTVTAAQHAIASGFITEEALADVQSTREQELDAPELADL